MYSVKEVLLKYEQIDRKGMQILENASFKKFSGFPKSLENRFHVSIRPTEYSKKEIKEVIVSKLESLESVWGAKFFLANRNFPIHLTVFEGLYEGDSEAERDGIFKGLKNNELFAHIINDLKSSPIKLEHLLIDGGNLLLAAAEIPSSIIQIRQILEEKYRLAGLKPLAIIDILHSTIARIAEMPGSPAEQDFLKKYIEDMVGLKHQIALKPIILLPSDLNTNNAYSVLTKF